MKFYPFHFFIYLQLWKVLRLDSNYHIKHGIFKQSEGCLIFIQAFKTKLSITFFQRLLCKPCVSLSIHNSFKRVNFKNFK